MKFWVTIAVLGVAIAIVAVSALASSGRKNSPRSGLWPAKIARAQKAAAEARADALIECPAHSVGRHGPAAGPGL